MAFPSLCGMILHAHRAALRDNFAIERRIESLDSQFCKPGIVLHGVNAPVKEADIAASSIETPNPIVEEILVDA